MRRVDFESVPCPNCGDGDFAIFARGAELETFQYYKKFEGFDRLNYVRCNDCKLIFANPRLAYTDATLNDLFPDHVAKREIRLHERRHRRANGRFLNLVDLAGDRRGRFLDIGCGFGGALCMANEVGFEAVGTELYTEFVNRGHASGLDIRKGNVDSIPFEDESCDVVYLDDVLEHLKNPFQYLDEVGRVLKPGGIAFVHTWAIGSPTNVFEGFGPAWRSDANLDLTAHTTIFPRQMLMNAMTKRGIAIERADLTKELSNPPAGVSADHHIQFWDIYGRKS